MKTAYAVAIVMALFLVSACGPTVNAPADEAAIKDLVAGYEKGINERNLDWISANFWTDDAALLIPNQMPISGKEAAVARDQAIFDQYSSISFKVPVEEVQSSGDLAVVKGTFYWTGTPVASGLSDVTLEGKWIETFNRQDDGSWKCSQLIWNSDQPETGATADGADEEALLQIERDWINAAINKDKAALDSILADDYVSRGEQGVRNKRQAIAQATGSALKIESAEHNNLQPMVFGDTAVVHGLTTVEGAEGRQDISGQYRWTDIFERRDGRWQAVASYGTAVE
jgi:ketosteroid isomerase-like protein